MLTYGAGGEHEPLLASLLAEGMPPEAILVVHNPSAAGEPDPPVPAGCELLRASHNLGYAAGMNLGIERQLEAGCELLLLLTHDARLRPGALAALVEGARDRPRFGALGPVLVHTGTEEPFSYGGFTRANGSMGHRTEPIAGEGGIVPCDWVDGGTMLLRSAALERVGGFDEHFWGYCEEAELCLRIARAGFRIGVLPAALADQDPGGPKRLGPWSYLLARNGAAYAWRAVGAPGVAFVSARAGGFVALALARAAARGLRLRGGPPGDPWAMAVGTGRGLLDFYRGRWGPPPPLPGAGDVGNLEPPAKEPSAAERPRVLQVGPDVRGGMRAVMRALLASPLGERYRMEAVWTHRGTGTPERLAVYCAALWRIAWWSLRGRGRIVHVHATVRGSMLRKAVCVLLAKALRRRVVLHMHSGPGDVAFERERLGPARAALFRGMFDAADTVLAVSAASARALERAHAARGVAVVPNPAPAAPERAAAATANPPLVLYLGGFANPVKGGEVLLDALSLPEAAGLSVRLAGPGEPPPRGRELLAERPGLEWRGWLGDEERERALEEAEIFVLPATSEGLPMALLEAMAWGRAIVATEVGGVPEVLSDGDDALLVAPGSPPALAGALARLAADAGLRRRLGAAARERARRLNSEEVTDRLDRIYRELLSD